MATKKQQPLVKYFQSINGIVLEQTINNWIEETGSEIVNISLAGNGNFALIAYLPNK